MALARDWSSAIKPRLEKFIYFVAGATRRRGRGAPLPRSPMKEHQKAWLGLALTLALSGCGGGGSGGSQAPAEAASTPTPTPTSTPTPTPTPTATPTPTPSQGQNVVSVTVKNLGAAGSNLPSTFGQPFKQGDVPSGSTLVAKLADGAEIPTQMDVKTRHPDGSVRHAIISLVLPKEGAGEEQKITLSTRAEAGAAADTKAALLDSGFQARMEAKIGSAVYASSAEDLLRSAPVKKWLAGAVANEWIVDGPLLDAQGNAHPLLSARWSIRHYPSTGKVKVDVAVENDWAFGVAPANVVYDAKLVLGGQTAYEKPALTHFHHARWRKVAWLGGDPQLAARQDIAYVIASKAAPNYDLSAAPGDAELMSLAANLKNSNTEPMGNGLVTPYMPMTGGRADIGPLPQWAAMHLLSMDPRAIEATLKVGDLAGSWPIHYRDKKTGRPVSLDDFPYMTLLGHYGDTINPKTGKSEAFPDCGGDCSTAPFNYDPDSPHQPSLAYLPYLLTGDYYYLEELQFWSDWNLFRSNPGYRAQGDGLLRSEQVRGQAWSLRTLAHSASITPDADPMKAYFVDKMNKNIADYTARFLRPSLGPVNALGVIDTTSGGAVVYTTASGPNTGIAPWQDDFFTWSVGNAVELGFVDALPMLKWKAQFPVGRMTAPGYCWTDGAVYAMAIQGSSAGPTYSTFAQAYQATMRNPDGAPLALKDGTKFLDQPCASQAQANWRTQNEKESGSNRYQPWLPREMTGYADSDMGYPANMQPALAAAVDSGIPGAAQAWSIFQSRDRKPTYKAAPEFAIIPR